MNSRIFSLYLEKMLKREKRKSNPRWRYPGLCGDVGLCGDRCWPLAPLRLDGSIVKDNSLTSASDSVNPVKSAVTQLPPL